MRSLTTQAALEQNNRVRNCQQKTTTIRKKREHTAARERETGRDRDEQEEKRVQDSFYYTTCAVDRWW